MPESSALAAFAQRLAFLRAQKQMSQTQLAEALGYGKSTLSRWEDGDTSPGVVEIRRVVEFFGCTADYLLGISDHPQHLRPGDWLVDLVVLDAALAGKQLGPTERLGVPIPARFQVVDSSRYAALDAQARDALRPRKKPR